MKILIKTIAGSHLFGVNTKGSDLDYKGVYLPTPEQILMGNYPDTIQESTGNPNGKNTKEDIDVELYSLKKFLQMLAKGDTAAFELLFTPEDLIEEKDPLWDKILEHKDELISKNIVSLIGYARHQANKFGIKGARLGELVDFRDKMFSIMEQLGNPSIKLKNNWDEILEITKEYKHITIGESNGHPMVNILGKKFDYHCTFVQVNRSIKKVYKEYGMRAREAKSKGGVDYKALSHALRISIQGIELLETGKMTLPLAEENRELVLKVKLGEMEHEEISDLIETNLEILEELKKTSDLQDGINKETATNILLDFHGNVCYNYMRG